MLVSSCLTVFPPVLYAAAPSVTPAAVQTQYDFDNDIFHPV